MADTPALEAGEGNLVEVQVLSPAFSFFYIFFIFSNIPLYQATQKRACPPKRSEGGYGLVAEHILAKDETGVRFSLPAPKSKSSQKHRVCKNKTGDFHRQLVVFCVVKI